VEEKIVFYYSTCAINLFSLSFCLFTKLSCSPNPLKIMAQEPATPKDQPQPVRLQEVKLQELTLFEALEALEKVKIYMLEQEKDKNRMMEEYARLYAEGSANKDNR